MKRSKIVLGLTTGLLAVAGMVAAKTARHTLSANFYTNLGTPGATICATYPIQVANVTVTPGGGRHVLKTNVSTGRTLFTDASGIQCVNPLYTGGN